PSAPSLGAVSTYLGNPMNFWFGRYLAIVADFIEGGTGESWRENRFTFEALRAALIETLDKSSHHVPSEPKDPPEMLAAMAKQEQELRGLDDHRSLLLDPVQFGRFRAFEVWHQLKQEKPSSLLIHPVFHDISKISENMKIPMKWDASHRY